MKIVNMGDIDNQRIDSIKRKNVTVLKCGPSLVPSTRVANLLFPSVLSAPRRIVIYEEGNHTQINRTSKTRTHATTRSSEDTTYYGDPVSSASNCWSSQPADTNGNEQSLGLVRNISTWSAILFLFAVWLLFGFPLYQSMECNKIGHFGEVDVHVLGRFG